MIEYLLGGTFLPVDMMFVWVIYTDYQINKQHEERQDDE